MASAYIYIYLIALGIIIFRQYSLSLAISPFQYNYKGTSLFIAVLLMIACILFVGLRPVDNAFADMVGYNDVYEGYFGMPFYFERDVQDPLFENIMLLFASSRIPSEWFFTFIDAIYYGLMFVACKKLFPNNLLVSYLTCLTAFSTFSYGTNGIRAGAAASIFLVALAYKEKIWLTVLLALISYGFHHSMHVVIVAFICSFFFKRTKWYFYLWFVAIILALLHVSYFQILFADYTDEKGAGYLLTDRDSFVTGFRPDFLLYSAVPVVLGYWLKFKKGIENEEYNLWLRMYLLTNTVWLLCMYADFANRIAYLSWFMYPIVLIFPFFKITWSERQTLYAKRTVLYHYLFTLFMDVIYYVFIK